jgi:hypothetical protein
MSTTTSADEFRQALALLTSRVEAVEARLAQNGADPPPPLDLASVMTEVREITQKLFPGKCEFTSECDPEYPEDRYVVVEVEATGEPKEIIDRESVWDERIRQRWPNLWDTLRLLVVPR